MAYYYTTVGQGTYTTMWDHRIVQGSNGHLFALRYDISQSPYRLFLCRSTDKGRTWNNTFHLLGTSMSGTSMHRDSAIFSVGDRILVVMRSGSYDVSTVCFLASASSLSGAVTGFAPAYNYPIGSFVMYDPSTNNIALIQAIARSPSSPPYGGSMYTTSNWGSTWTSQNTLYNNFAGVGGGAYKLSNGQFVGFYVQRTSTSGGGRTLWWFNATSLTATPVLNFAFGIDDYASIKTTMLNNVVYCFVKNQTILRAYYVSNGVLTSINELVTGLTVDDYMTATTVGNKVYVILFNQRTGNLRIYTFQNNSLTLFQSITTITSVSSHYIDAPDVAKGGIYLYGSPLGYSTTAVSDNAVVTLSYNNIQGKQGAGLVNVETLARWDGVKLVSTRPAYWNGVRLTEFN